MYCKNVCLCLRRCVCVKCVCVYVHITKNVSGGYIVTLMQKGLSCGQHSPRCLTENKQTIKSFNFKRTKIDRLPSEINCMCQSEGE